MCITVLLPTYNGSKYIDTAIKSVLNQTYTNFELLIIDDGSNDNTKEIVNKFSDLRIRYKYKIHTGLWDTLNYGLKIARNNIVARMDADDIALPYRLEKQIRYLNSNPDIDVISSWYAVFKKQIDYIIKTSITDIEIKRRMLLHSEIAHPGLIYNKNKILSLGGYRNYIVEDFELWLRNLNKLKFHNIPEVLTLVRYRNDSNFNSNIKLRNQEIFSLLDIYQPIYSNQLAADPKVLDDWKEYFFGDKNKARKLFLRNGFFRLLNPKIFAAYMSTFLKESTFEKMLIYQLKFRINYVFGFFTPKCITLRKAYNKIITSNII